MSTERGLLDELLLVTGLAPLLETNLTAEPCETRGTLRNTPRYRRTSVWRRRLLRVHYTGGLDWLALYDLAEEKGEHVRPDWKGEEPPSNVNDVRAAAAPLALWSKWTTLFSCRFFTGKRINPVELESFISLFRRITREGIRRTALAWLWEPSQKDDRAHDRYNFLLRKLGFWCLANDIAQELILVPAWANPADATSRSKPIERVCLFAKASASADRSFRIIPCPLRAGSAP